MGPVSGGFGIDRPSGGFGIDSDFQGGDQCTVEHLEALIVADKRLVKSLRRQVDNLNDELARLDELCDREEREARREQREGEKMDMQRSQLEQQLQAMRKQLANMKDEHHAANLEHIGLRRDREHYAQEVAFLQKALDEDLQNISALRQANEYLETSLEAVDLHTSQLEQVRKEAQEQVRNEKESMRREEREIAEMKQAMDMMKVEREATSARMLDEPVEPSSPSKLLSGPLGYTPSVRDEPIFSAQKGLASPLQDDSTFPPHARERPRSLGGEAPSRVTDHVPKGHSWATAMGGPSVAGEPRSGADHVPHGHSWATALGRPAAGPGVAPGVEQDAGSALGQTRPPPGYRPPGRMFPSPSDREGV